MLRNAVSLFSSAGIGDLGLRANGVATVVGCEIVEDRAKLFKENNPEAKCFLGDIWVKSDEIVEYYQSNFKEPPFLVLATPPCQGMSSNGMGKMLSDIRKGVRPKDDPRNRLIIPAVSVVQKLKPRWVVLENVATMTNTVILDDEGNPINIIEYIMSKLGSEYVGKPAVIDVADYGVPQHRKRLLTVLTRTEKGRDFYQTEGRLLPKPTHNSSNWVTMEEAIGSLPKLEAVKGKNKDVKFHPLHKVPLLDEKKLFWLDNTPEGATAFNNQCVNPECLYKENALHGAKQDSDGINKTNTDTPLFCEKCKEILPRPWVEDKDTGECRLMKGYVSAYKRMYWNEPASTLTQNFQYACSDNKVHPSQSRVLSLYEGLIIQSIASYDYKFEIDGKLVKDGLIRDSIGESVPPKVTDLICKHIIEIEQNEADFVQLQLF